MPSASFHPRGLAALMGAVLAFSTAPVFIHFFAGHVDAWTQNCARYSAGMAFWLPYLVVVSCRQGGTGDVWRAAWVPGLVNILLQTAWGWSAYFLTPTLIALLSQTSVLWAAVFSAIALADERPLLRSPLFWVAVVVALVGTAGVIAFDPSAQWHHGDTDNQTGTLLTGLAVISIFALLWAAYATTVRHYLSGHDPRTSFAVVTVYTTVGCWLLAFKIGQPGMLLDVPVHVLGLIGISGIVNIALAHTFLYTGIRHSGVLIAAVMMRLLPFLTYVWSYIIFHEQLSAGQWIAAGVLIAGTALALLAQSRLHRH